MFKLHTPLVFAFFPNIPRSDSFSPNTKPRDDSKQVSRISRRNAVQCIEEEEFTVLCQERLTGASATTTNFIASQQDYASFLNSLGCVFDEAAKDSVVCWARAEGTGKDFYAQPIVLQLHFVESLCTYMEKKYEGTTDCMESMMNEQFDGSMFGFRIGGEFESRTYSDNNRAESAIEGLCSGMYDIVISEGLIPKCPVVVQVEPTNPEPLGHEGYNEVRTGVFVAVGAGFLFFLGALLFFMRRMKIRNGDKDPVVVDDLTPETP